MGESPESKIVELLLDRYGETYAAEAGIKLADRPAPLYQLLVLATLLSARISAKLGVSGGRALFEAGYGTPDAMRSASWQDRVDALGRGHYRRYDESSATMLGDAADHLQNRWRDDLRKLHAEGGDDPKRLRKLLTEFSGIGPTGADIFLREVQPVWQGIQPFVDRRVAAGAKRVGLPGTADQLSRLVRDPATFSRLTAALVRVSLSRRAADEIRTEAGSD